jgi:hypothetical protein
MGQLYILPLRRLVCFINGHSWVWGSLSDKILLHRHCVRCGRAEAELLL